MSPKVYIVPLSNHLKKVATMSVAKRLEEVVDEPLLYSLMGAAIEGRKMDEDVLDCLKRIDLTRVMKGSEGVSKPFPCTLFAERTAWIYKDDNDYFRYYSRKNTGIYSFDILDLLGIIRNEKKKEVFSFIQAKWKIKGLTDWYMEQMDKYRSNQWILDGLEKDDDNYPNLHKLIKKHWIVLEKLIEFATSKLTGKQLSANGEAVFFLSNNYFKEQYFPKYSNSTINNLVNLFCILGFLKKVPFDDIPKSLSNKAVVHYKNKGVKNYTSYYRLMDFREAFEEAEKRAEILLNEKLYYHRLSKTEIAKLFGESFASEIYVQATFGKKAKAEPIFIKGQDTHYTESERLEEKFLNELKTTGKCTKSILADSTLLPRRRFDDTWKSLIRKYQCKEKFPTKIEMRQYEMEKRLLIAVPTEEGHVD